MRTNDETESEFEDRIEGAQDEEPGNQDATTSRLKPSGKVSRKPSTPFAISPRGKAMPKKQPKGKFVTSSRRRGKIHPSKAKNRSGKKYKKGGPGKQPPTVSQRMKSFGGMA